MNSNGNEIYILNPCYFLHNDIYRCQIGSYSIPRYNDIVYTSDRLLNIHPYVAQLLSVFDGKKTLDDCVTLLSKHFKLSNEAVFNIVSLYIENKEWIGSENTGTVFRALENMLILKKSYDRQEYYKIEDFKKGAVVNLGFCRNIKPVSCIFELTMKCFTNCEYCYANREYKGDGLSTEKIIDIIQQLYDYGVKDVDINGGEVLLHPDIKKILEKLASCNFYPLISTKYPVGQDMLQFLKRLGFNHIQISLDSVNPQTLSSILHVDADYFEKIAQTMKQLDEMNFSWQTNTIITKYNEDIETEIIPLFSFLTSFKNIRRIACSEAGFSLYKSNSHYQHIKPKLSSFKTIIPYIQNLKKEFPSIIFKEPSPLDVTSFLNNDFDDFQERAICTGNERSFVILPDGKVTICEELYWFPQFIIGDLLKNTIEEIWSGEKAKTLFNIKQDSIRKESACHSCKEFSICRHHKGVCWKMIMQAYGTENWDFPDPKCPFAPPIINKLYCE